MLHLPGQLGGSLTHTLSVGDVFMPLYCKVTFLKVTLPK